MKRILIPSILVATILVGGVLAYAIWQAVPQTSTDYYNSGKKAYDQKKYEEATIQFQNSIQKDQKNRDARYYLALSYLEQRKVNEAAKQLNATAGVLS
jgi:TolA-binding protein